MNTFVRARATCSWPTRTRPSRPSSPARTSISSPSATILIENPIAVLKGTQNPTEAKAFVDFTRSDAAQNIWATYGYRPIVKSVFDKWAKTFPVPKQLFTIRDVVKGGWPVVQPKFFDPNNGIVKQIQST